MGRSSAVSEEGLLEGVFDVFVLVFEGRLDDLRFSLHAQEDNNVVFDLESSLLSEFLDLVDDFSGNTHFLHLFVLSQVKKDLNIRFTSQFDVFRKTFSLQELLDGEESVSEFEVVDDKLSILHEFLSILVGQALDLLSEVVVVILLEFLAEFSVVGGDLVSDILVDVSFEEDLSDVDFFFNVDEEWL